MPPYIRFQCHGDRFARAAGGDVTELYFHGWELINHHLVMPVKRRLIAKSRLWSRRR